MLHCSLYSYSVFRTALEESPLCDFVHLNTLEVDLSGSLCSDVIPCILDQLKPVKTVTVHKLPSDPWYDESCRDEKRAFGRLPRQYNRGTTIEDKATNCSLGLGLLRNYRRHLNTKPNSFWLDETNSNPSAP